MTDVLAEIRKVPPPTPILDRETEAALTERQRQLLDRLSDIFDLGFVDRTMSDLAAELECSLRTLYQLAPGRDELVLTVIDRNLWRVGRAARYAISPDGSPLASMAAYLFAANNAVAEVSEPFARDVAATPAAVELQERHEAYLVAVTHRLLDLAVAAGEIPDVDTSVVARAAASMGLLFARHENLSRTRSDPRTAANLAVELLVAGLRSDEISQRRVDERG